MRPICSSLFLICGLLTQIASADERSYLFEIPVSRLVTTAEPFDDYIQATLDVPNVGKAAAMISQIGAIDVLHTTATQIVVGVPRDATGKAMPGDNDRADTFVVDFSEAPVMTALAELQLAYGKHPTPEQIRQFVFDYIEDKNYLRRFDLASRVAQTRAGDCTEHAVLLAALARASGYPARVALGVVLISVDERSVAYGHAWTEVHSGDTWVLADGTVPIGRDSAAQTFYLPLMTLENEGPGYTMDVARLMIVQPSRVTDIGNLGPDDLSPQADNDE